MEQIFINHVTRIKGLHPENWKKNIKGKLANSVFKKKTDINQCVLGA